MSQRFVQAAENYLAWAESPPGEPVEEARSALRLLVALYLEGLTLGHPEQLDYDRDSQRLNHDEWKAKFERFSSLPFNYYSVVFDPHVVPPEDPVIGDLADDLADIYADLWEGFSLHRSGHPSEALWTWWFSCQSHWGRHAASAVRALHTWFEKEGAW